LKTLVFSETVVQQFVLKYFFFFKKKKIVVGKKPMFLKTIGPVWNYSLKKVGKNLFFYIFKLF